MENIDRLLSSSSWPSKLISEASSELTRARESPERMAVAMTLWRASGFQAKRAEISLYSGAAKAVSSRFTHFMTWK